jgi:hypothetical protein
MKITGTPVGEPYRRLALLRQHGFINCEVFLPGLRSIHRSNSDERQLYILLYQASDDKAKRGADWFMKQSGRAGTRSFVFNDQQNIQLSHSAAHTGEWAKRSCQVMIAAVG